MSGAQTVADSRNRLSAAATSSSETGTLVTWTAHEGDAAKSHVVHVDSSGIAWAVGIQDPEAFNRLIGEATARSDEAATIIASFEKGHRVTRESLFRVVYCEQLRLLMVVDQDDNTQKFVYGKNKEQRRIFEAVRQHLRGRVREEEAGAWTVMQRFFPALGVLAVVGGFLIFFTTIADPSYRASGRRSGLHQLINWLGYTIGPMWMSTVVGALAVLVFGRMLFLLMKRPNRQILDF